MGRGIAQVCAAAGCDVRLYDAAPEAPGKAILALRQDLEQAVAKGRLTDQAAQETLARLHPVMTLEALAGCELVVEAIVESLPVKQALFQQLEPIVGPDCVLATNTSSLSVTAIAAACDRPDRLAGWHFFNPVPRMRVVEVIAAPRTDPRCVDALVRLSERVGHRPVVTSDSPGFVVNHAGRAFVTEGLKLLAEQTAPHAVLDLILRQCAGFRMGPFELLDLTALDVSVPVMESIHSQYYGDDRYRPAAFARTRMVAGLLGRKSGEGFYKYEGGVAQVPLSHPASIATPVAGLPPRLWWPTEGDCALPGHLATLFDTAPRASRPQDADLLLLAPLGSDLTTAVSELGLAAEKAVGVDPLFGGASGVTLMTTAATEPGLAAALQALVTARGTPAHLVADSPGFVAPRVVACIVNLACEMAQQGIASPVDIDAAVRLGLGYPAGPFEWGDRLGPGRILQVLAGLYATFGDPRYRPAPWLVRRARLGLSLSAPDRRV